MDSKQYEIARIDWGINDNCHCINFQNGRGEAGLGYFNTLEEAKTKIKEHKTKHPAESWPYVVIDYGINTGSQDAKGKLVYIEYNDYKLEKQN